MKILVVGTWNPVTSRKYSLQANELGYELARRNHILVASPSSGFQGLVAQAYKQSGGSEFIGYFPELKFMQEIGEDILVQPDVPIYTNQDYPVRNVLQIKNSDAVIGVTGETGTLTELIISIKNYKLPTSFYKGSSNLIDFFKTIEPYFAERLKYGDNIAEMLDYLENTCTK